MVIKLYGRYWSTQKHQYRQHFQHCYRHGKAKFATSRHQWTNKNDTNYVFRENEWPTTVVWPLVNSSIGQFLADHVTATVEDLFCMVSVLDYLTIYQLPESLELNNPRIQIRWVIRCSPLHWAANLASGYLLATGNLLATQWSGEQPSILTCHCQSCHVYKQVMSLMTCIQFRLFIKEYVTHWQTFCID